MKDILIKLVANLAMALPVLLIILVLVGSALDFIGLKLAMQVYPTEFYTDNFLITFSRDFWSLIGY